MTRQPEQQQQRALHGLSTYPCPTCKQSMRMVGRERSPGSRGADLLTFQCGCGQIIATMTDQ